MAEVRLRNLNKRFGDIIAVHNVDLTVYDKEFLVLVGPSGCGKSTTLRMIAGLEEISEGEIYIGDRLVNDDPPKDRNIAMVFQSYALYPHMNVFQNMAFGLINRKHSKADIERRVKDGANMLGIADLFARKPKELSGGQRQRVAMGRAIVRNPEVFLFDEPLSNLDAKLRVVTRGELKKLHERVQTTMIYVTHDQIEAMTLADRIVIMDHGKVSQIGSPMEVFNNPKNMFVAGFIGSPAMNFLEVHVVEEDDQLWIKGDGFQLRVPENQKCRYQIVKGRKAVFGIRPEHIYDRQIRGDFPGGEIMNAKVDVIEPIGSQSILLLKIGPHQLSAVVDSNSAARPHADIQFLFDMNQMHLFDTETEEVIGCQI
ncbi:MAG: sn-glycerol-3-phosphate ABC transporter ATP-binding protein UgpC [Desulfobacterales bacterium]|nr:MAG: sn-glycerol-3-phosphate ABC transporter ATP-binding protein UgpC [Desulfobacterales bacterium]